MVQNHDVSLSLLQTAHWQSSNPQLLPHMLIGLLILGVYKLKRHALLQQLNPSMAKSTLKGVDSSMLQRLHLVTGPLSYQLLVARSTGGLQNGL